MNLLTSQDAPGASRLLLKKRTDGHATLAALYDLSTEEINDRAREAWSKAIWEQTHE